MIPFWDTDTTGYPTWLYSPNPWECLTLGGERIPGIVDCTAIAKLATNKAKPSGKHGARLTSTGKDPQEAEIKVRISNPKQWIRWQEVDPRIYSSDRKDFNALDAVAPAFAAVRIKSITVLSIASPAPGQVPQERVIVIKIHEHSPPAKKDATKTPLASKVKLRDEFQPVASGSGQNFTPANAQEAPPSQSRATCGP